MWGTLQGLEPTRSLIELFDMVWWMHFRRVEPLTVRRIARRGMREDEGI